MFKNTKKKVLSTIIALCLLATLQMFSFSSEAGFDNYKYSSEYINGQFRDVRGTEWFARYVEDAYNFGFIKGKSANVFDHAGLLTFGEAVTLAARLSKIYSTGDADFEESVPFYAAYADYALLNGIIDSPGNYISPATRAEFAQLVYNALPPEAFPEINDISDYGICDVMPDSGYGPAVYALYRAGILSGSDRYGTFFPGSCITRAEACAVMVRLADPAARLKTKLPAQIPAEDIFLRSVNAVFMLETFDIDGKSIRTGSGFFISDTGLAVTGLHVFENAASATATLFDGSVYKIPGVYEANEDYNLALFPISDDNTVGGFCCLNIADSDKVESGNTVYALGSPRDLINTITDGIISNASRKVDRYTFIQFTAPISFGSGGSPVLNTLGQVIGVASSTFSYGQNINLAIPANLIKELKIGKLATLESLLHF